MIRLGYVGINTELPTASRTFRLAGYSEERMLDITQGNLWALEEILKWNKEHAISLFRITSNLVPFGSHSINSGIWKEKLKDEFVRIGKFIKKHVMRVSMHPGQYTVLNTPHEINYANTVKDLEYHTAVLDLMKLDRNCVIVLHGGGVYGEKQIATARLEERIAALPSKFKKRVVLENDERNYSAFDILNVCKNTHLRGILDVFHHRVLPSCNNISIRELIRCYGETWQNDGRQKIHYSNQAPNKLRGAHSESIDITEFEGFYKSIKDLELDIMLETKDKQNSVLALRKAFPELQ
jgi:UV DNA damage endonuclease